MCVCVCVCVCSSLPPKALSVRNPEVKYIISSVPHSVTHTEDTEGIKSFAAVHSYSLYLYSHKCPQVINYRMLVTTYGWEI